MREFLRRTYDLDLAKIVIEQPPNVEFGEYALPLAFELAKKLRKAPRKIAEEIVNGIGPIAGFEKLELAGAGYINARLRPDIVILDEPTRGVDIGAKSEIYRIMDSLARTGMGIIFISSELPEIIGIADRVLVMRGGRIVGELDSTSGASITQEAVMELATAEDPATREAVRA